MTRWHDIAASPANVVPETADAALLDRPLRSLADVEAIERAPLDQHLRIESFSQRIALALVARPADDIAISYIPDGDVERAPEQVSFGALLGNIERTSALLRASGIGRTDVVAILLPGVPQIYWVLLGSMAAATAFPLNWMLEPPALLHLLQQADVKAVIALGPTPGFRIWESLMSIADGLPADVRIWSVAGPGGTRLPASNLDVHIAAPGQGKAAETMARRGDDIAVYVHSGGTTGAPKIVKLSQHNLSYRHWTLQLASNLRLGEVVLHDTPMFHVGGLIGRVLSPLASGASVLIPSVMGGRDKRYMANYWKFAEKYRVTRLSGVPTTLAVLAKSAPETADLSALAPCFITGSTALPVAVREDFERVSGTRVLNSYGMTENTASIAVDPRNGPRKDGSSGIRLPYTQIRVVALQDRQAGLRLCEAGEIGMLQIKGPGTAQGYVDAAHAAAGRTEDGWLITGDLGRIDADGYVFVTGRAKDVIIRGGHNIDPALIEEPLLQLPEVLHAAAVGKPDGYAGEVPVAYVQLVPGAQRSAENLVAYLKGCIAERAATPKEIIILDKLPLTDVGKPLKAKLRLDSAERAFQAVIAQAAGLSADSPRLEVAAQAHPTLGVSIAVAVADIPQAQRAGLTDRIAEAMSAYAYSYTLAWT